MQKTYSQGLASTTRNMIAVFATLLMAFIFMLSPTVVYAQVAPDPFSCYGIADEYNGDGNTDGLAIINRLTGDANLIGTGTGTAGIEAMAFVPQDVNGTVQQVLFAVADPNNPNTTSSNTLGTVDLTTGIWTPIDAAVQIGTGTDANGTTFDFSTSGDIDGLTYDVQRNILWATQRNAGDGNPDYLLQLDPATGQIVPDAFGPGIDWVAVPLATDPAFQTDAGLPYDDVDDLAVDPITGRIYIINNKGGTGGGLVELDPITGLPLNYIGLFTGTTSVDGIVDDMEGLAFFNDGQLYGSTGNNGPDPADLNQLFTIDIATGAAALAGAFPDETRDIEALGCLTAPAFITLEKATNGEDADQPTGPAITVGEPVTWTYVIENTGSVDLLDMTLNDDIEGDISNRCVEGALPNPFAPGATFTCTVVGVASVTGQYANIGTVNATYQAPVEGGTEDIPLAATDPSHYFGEFNPLPGIEIVKTAGDAVDGETYNAGAPGVVTFTYVVTNTGNTHLTNITINDDAGTPDDTSDDVITDSTTCAGLAGPLAPDGTVTCTADIQVDGDATNIATTTGTPTDENGTPYPDVEPPTDNDDAVVVVTPLVPGISIVKTAGDAADGGTLTITEAGLVTFTYVVENTGDTHLSDITIVDDAGTPADAGDDVTVDSTTCAELAGPLAPGGTVTCTAAIQVNGDATNVAVTTGNPTDENGVDIPDATNPTADDPAIVVLAVPGISIVKTAGDAADGDTFTISGPGLVTFTYVVENTGGTHLSDITIVDDAGTPADASDDVTVDSTTCAELAGPLAPGGTVTCTAAIQVNGNATNVAVTTGNPTDENGVDIPGATNPTADDPAIVVLAVPGISIVKTAGDAADGDTFTITEPGLVTFIYVVENTGGTYLSDITIVDDAGTSADASDDVTVDSTTCAELAGPLAPGGIVTCTAAIQVNGDATNVAVTTGNPTDENGVDIPNATDPVDDDPAVVEYTPGVPGISIVKTAGNAVDGAVYEINEPGPVTFTYFVENTGTTYLIDITIADDAGTPADASDDVLLTSAECAGLAGPLAPGGNVTCTADIQVDGDAINVATTTGTPSNEAGDPLPDVEPPTAEDDAEVILLGTIGDTVWFDVNGDGIQSADENGIPGVTLTLTQPDGSTVTTVTDGDGLYLFTELPAGDYFVTVDAGSLPPNAIAQTYDADGLTTPNESSLTLGSGEDNLLQDFGYQPAGPGISIIKTAGDAADGDILLINSPGDVTYQYVVTNIGNTYLTDITITDDAGTPGDISDDVLITGAECAGLAGPLEPQGFVICTTDIAVDGTVTNNAGTTGTPSDENGNPLPDVDPPTDEDDAVVEFIAGPGISITKTAGDAIDGDDYVVNAPEEVLFTFLVENTGNTHLTEITITDDAGTAGDTSDDVTITSSTCPELAGPLAPSGTVVCTLVLAINSDTTNNAGTTGTPTDENGVPLLNVDPPTDEDDAVVLLQAGPGIQLLKTVFEGHSAGAGCPGGELVEAASGSPVTYCFEVKNTGTTYLNNIEVNDPDLGITRTDMTLLSGTEPLAQDQSLIFYYETTLDTSLLNTADTTGIPSDENGVPIPDLTPPTDDDTAEVIPFSMLGDRVWFDINANGVQDPDEEGIAGVTVTLYDESNNVIETQVTDENGNYGFFVAPGAYSISFDADDLEGYYLSPLDAIADDSTDSDADPGNDGRTEPTSLIVGESDMSWDAGVFAPPNLQIAKDDGGAIIQPNGTVIYSIVYSNTGVSDATGVIITERVPEYTTFSPELSTPGWDCEQLPGAASETCSFEIGRVAKGSTGRLTLTFVVFVDRFIPEDVFAINNVVTITDDESKGAIPDGQFTDELITPIFRPTDLNLIPEPGFTGNARVEIYLPTIMVR